MLAQHPSATFQVASVTLGSATGERRWLRDPADVETAARRLSSWGSAFWSALESARRVGANVVVLITDGQSTDTPEQLVASRGRHRLVPTSEGPFAFWAVDRSGSLIGILPDGRMRRRESPSACSMT